uniref:ATP synthase F0 subunit 8 n=1 Tax=Neucentropus mandjuricus TaxID=1223783 RepID=UPI0021141A57|nr:ATP synthase F0 subunit 8 [Neucentropus mandjuricus]UUC08018.1 ATP synthase F0 subunit 8 [Neucentropus mandjuricus]
MPQMFPSNWLMLFFYISISMISIMIINYYYSNNYIINKKMNKNINKIKYNLKW